MLAAVYCSSATLSTMILGGKILTPSATILRSYSAAGLWLALFVSGAALLLIRNPISQAKDR
jgi:hypothetical protein